MNLNSWDYYDLEQEMSGVSMSKLLELYKREEVKYSNKCSEFLDSFSKFTEEGKKDFEKECEFLLGCKMKIALRIADMLTK